MKKLSFPALLVLLLLPLFLSAQDKQGKLIGTVTDSARKPLAYATVNLFQVSNTNNPLKSTYTDKKGRFELSADTGKYQLTISHVNLAASKMNVTIASGENVIDSIVLTSNAGMLESVTITVRKPLIEQGDDRLTYNVESDPAAKSEMATDLLRKTPMITVDGDGNVQLNGQSNFKILLNGRETAMFAQNVKDALKNFPGSVISKIEVITSPSAKYDAEGVGGIINIITKKKVIGYNGTVSSYASTLSNYSESLSLNIKTGKVGISGHIGLNGSFNDIRSSSTSETTPTTTAIFNKRTLTGERLGKNNGRYSYLEITYDLDSFKTISFYGSAGNFRSEGNSNHQIRTDYPSQSPDFGYYYQDNSSNNPNSGAGLDFIRRFRNVPEKEFSIRVNGQFNRGETFNNSLQENPQQDRYVINNSVSKNREITVQTDFVQPLKNKQKLEGGLKAVLRNALSDFESQVKYHSSDPFKPNPFNSDKFSYHQEVYGLYGSYSFYLRKYSMRLGIRAEETHVSGDFVSAKTEVKQSYFNVIPNLLVTKKFTPVYTFTGSYNMRLNRPYINSLNPFVNNNDSLNISYGNPDLGPQVLHSVSLQNRFLKGKFFLNLSLYGSYTDNMIAQFISFNPATGVTSTTSANVGREYQTSVGVNISTPIGEKLNVGLNTQLRYNNVENKSNLLQHNEGFSGLAAGNFNYRVVGKFTISGSGGIFRGNYSLTGTPSINAFYQANFGYKFFKDKLSVTMNVNNFHDKYLRFRNEVEQPGLRIVNTNYNPFRVVYFGATYSFGKLKENVSKKKGVTNDDLVQ